MVEYLFDVSFLMRNSAVEIDIDNASGLPYLRA